MAVDETVTIDPTTGEEGQVEDETTTTTVAEPEGRTFNFDQGVIDFLRSQGRLIRADLPMAITAAPGDGGRWHSVLVVEGTTTTDGREFAPGALRTRPLTLPLMLLDENSYFGHEGAVICGAIETAVREGSNIRGTGFFDAGENGQEAERLVRAQMLRWVSVDVEVIEYEIVYGPDDDPWWDFGTFRILEANLMGATICAFPAFPQAVIAMEDQDLPQASAAGEAAAQALGMQGPLAVAACAAEGLPPAGYFDNPGLAGPTRLTIDEPDEAGWRRVYGHLAVWGVEHLSRRLFAPRDVSVDYPYFRTGRVRAEGAEGPTEIRTGVLTMGTDHASTASSVSWAQATQHYADTGHGVADIAVGHDDHGVWFSGVVRPETTEGQLRIMRATRQVSGDWRPVGGRREMVGLLVVNVGAFPIPEAVVAAAGLDSLPVVQPRASYREGEMVAMVAAGLVPANPDVAEMRHELARLQSVVSDIAMRDYARRAGVGS